MSSTSISDPIITIRPLNFPIMIDQRFDLDEALTFTHHQSTTPYDDHDDHDRIISADQNPDSDISGSLLGTTAVAAAATTWVADVDSCAVCMEIFSSGDSREPVGCGHVYHSGCIATWLSVSDSCPLCRCRIFWYEQFSGGGKKL